MHIGVDTFINMLPDRLYRYSLLLSILVSIVYTAGLCWFGILFVGFLIDIGQLSPDLEWPIWTVFIIVPLSNAMMTVRFVQQFIAEMQNSSLKRGRSESGEMPPLLRKVIEEKGRVE